MALNQVVLATLLIERTFSESTLGTYLRSRKLANMPRMARIDIAKASAGSVHLLQPSFLFYSRWIKY